MQNVIDDWIHTTEILHDAVLTKDGNEAFESLTILLMQLVDRAGATHPTVVKLMPTLLGIKQNIQDEQFEECLPTVRAILALLRQTRSEWE